MGAGESIKAAFKEKFDVRTRLKAKVTGIKEKFDILNIAKFMTGGSNVAPALLGKLLGRDKADIRNFTGGRQSYEDFGSPTATKIGRDPHAGGGDTTGMSEVLNKILELQQRTYDNIKEQREKKNNFQEGKDLREQKRHEELLVAIKKLKPDEKQTAEKVPESGSSMDIMGIIESMLGAFGGLQTLLRIGTFLTGPVGLAIIGVTTLAGLAYLMWKNSDPEAVKEALKGEGAAGVGAAGLGAEGQMASPAMDEQTRKKLASGFDTKGLSGASLEELQAKKAEILDVGVDPRIKEKKGMTLDDVDKRRLKQINDIDAAIASKQKTAMPTGTETPQAPSAPASSTAEPASTTPPSQQLSTVTSENRTAKMDSMATTPTTTVNNVQATNTVKPKTPKDDIPSVRNMEATFQRMIFNSTRVV
jgi:hypothetical protein